MRKKTKVIIDETPPKIKLEDVKSDLTGNISLLKLLRAAFNREDIELKDIELTLDWSYLLSQVYLEFHYIACEDKSDNTILRLDLSSISLTTIGLHDSCQTSKSIKDILNPSTLKELYDQEIKIKNKHLKDKENKKENKNEAKKLS